MRITENSLQGLHIEQIFNLTKCPISHRSSLYAQGLRQIIAGKIRQAIFISHYRNPTGTALNTEIGFIVGEVKIMNILDQDTLYE